AAGGGWLLSANGALALANDVTRALAALGDGVVLASGGDVALTSHARPAARADAFGYSGAGVGAFGAAIADARAGASARSRLGNDVVIAGGADLAVDAQVMPGASYAARAEATTGAGAGLVGAVGARATARSTTTAAATTGARLTLPAGTVRIEAYHQPSQHPRGAGPAH